MNTHFRSPFSARHWLRISFRNGLYGSWILWWFLTVLILCAANQLASAQVTDENNAGRPKREAFANPKDNPNLPNVLLIGDSISIGYTKHVRQQLAGKANVLRIRGNGKHSGFGLQNLDKWIGSRKWDVIHFNWGLWDLCYRNPESKTQGNRDKINGKLTTALDQYRINMEKIVKRLKKTDAQLIWCTTTPVPEHEAGRILGDEIKYNAVAEKIMKANSISINDLHSHALSRMPDIQAKKGDVHFTDQGYSYLAEKVTREISTALLK